MRWTGYMVRLEDYFQADLAIPKLGFYAVSAPLGYALLYCMRCL